MKELLNKKYCGIKIFWFLPLVVLAISGIIIGSFLDKNISEALYNPSSGYGRFFESFGTALGYMMVPSAGMMLFLGLYKNKNVWLRVLAYVLLICSIIPVIYLYGSSLDETKEEYGMLTNKYLGYFIAFLFMAFSAFLTFLFVNKEDKRGLIVVGSVILISMILQLVLVNFLLKYLACRPRYRFLMGDALDKGGSITDYRAWWDMKPFLYTKGDYFKSWPSGHTATASITVLLCLLPIVSKKRFKFDQIIFFLIGSIYLLVVAFARIVAGAHFLSDVSFGALISLLGIFLTLFLVDLANRKWFVLPIKQE